MMEVEVSERELLDKIGCAGRKSRLWPLRPAIRVAYNLPANTFSVARHSSAAAPAPVISGWLGVQRSNYDSDGMSSSDESTDFDETCNAVVSRKTLSLPIEIFKKIRKQVANNYIMISQSSQSESFDLEECSSVEFSGEKDDLLEFSRCFEGFRLKELRLNLKNFAEFDSHNVIDGFKFMSVETLTVSVDDTWERLCSISEAFSCMMYLERIEFRADRWSFFHAALIFENCLNNQYMEEISLRNSTDPSSLTLMDIDCELKSDLESRPRDVSLNIGLICPIQSIALFVKRFVGPRSYFSNWKLSNSIPLLQKLYVSLSLEHLFSDLKSLEVEQKLSDEFLASFCTILFCSRNLESVICKKLDLSSVSPVSDLKFLCCKISHQSVLLLKDRIQAFPNLEVIQLFCNELDEIILKECGSFDDRNVQLFCSSWNLPEPSLYFLVATSLRTLVFDSVDGEDLVPMLKAMSSNRSIEEFGIKKGFDFNSSTMVDAFLLFLKDNTTVTKLIGNVWIISFGPKQFVWDSYEKIVSVFCEFNETITEMSVSKFESITSRIRWKLWQNRVLKMIRLHVTCKKVMLEHCLLSDLMDENFVSHVLSYLPEYSLEQFKGHSIRLEK